MSTTAPASCPDVETLRQSIYGKGAPTRTDLVGLMGLGAQAGDDPGFLALVADVARDAVLLAASPPGCLSEADADWLTARLGDGGGLACRAEFEALRTVMTAAASVPSALAAFAVREVERTILTGRRRPLGGADGESGIVTAVDVEALRTFCLAPNGSGRRRVERAAAEALFDIAHATATAPNDPDFAEFFAIAIADYLMGGALSAATTRDRAIDDDAPWRLRDFLAGLIEGVFGPRAEALKSVDRWGEERYLEENAQTDARRARAADIGAGEAKWALAHLTRGGDLSPAERRLLSLLRDETAAPSRIKALFGQAA